LAYQYTRTLALIVKHNFSMTQKELSILGDTRF